MPINDNSPNRGDISPPLHDVHGQAALLLVESLIHGLCENATLRANEAIDIAERAVSVQFDRAEAADGTATHMWQAHALLVSIAASLKIDGQDGPPAPRLVP